MGPKCGGLGQAWCGPTTEAPKCRDALMGKGTGPL